MKSIKVFLASSSELVEDRREFEIFLNRENKALINEGVFLELVIWEDFIDSMSKTRLQDEYNNAITRSDIFILLLHKKIGKYTLEEFNTAFGQFQQTGKPIIYTYFKDTPVNISELNKEDFEGLFKFQDKLKSLGHFYTKYSNIDSLKLQFSSQLNKLIDSEWEIFSSKEKVQQEVSKDKVFISYSHRDKDYLDRLMVHLKPLTTEGIVDIWVDTKIIAGEKWKIEIEKALKSAGVAILLISADFIASDFIVNNELPPLLDAAESKGTKIIPVIIKPCRFTRHRKLKIYQSINSPDRPLMGMSEFERETIYDKVAELVEVNILDFSD